jgi:LacI family transcriptional regulator
MKITLKEIAKQLNVSPTTVSKALQDYPDIGAVTKKKIKKYAKQVGYTPSIQAAYLRTQKTRIVGVIVPNFKDHFYNGLIEGVIKKASKNGYLVVILQSGDSQKKEKKMVNRLLHQQVDGIFISLARDTINYDHLNKIIESKTSLTLFDNTAKSINCNKISFDERNESFVATEHLIKNGCEKIMFFRDSLVSQKSIDQFIGYRKALDQYNIPFEKKYVHITENKMDDDAYEFIKALYNSKSEIEGIFIPNHAISLGVIKFFNEHKTALHDGVKIVSYSSLNEQKWGHSSLKLIKLNGKKMGGKIIKSFLNEQSLLKMKLPLTFSTELLKSKENITNLK